MANVKNISLIDKVALQQFEVIKNVEVIVHAMIVKAIVFEREIEAYIILIASHAISNSYSMFGIKRR